MDTEVIWSRERFPVLYEGSSPKAVMVDINTFAQIELILDNLLNREVEAEDAILTASTELKQLVTRAQQEQPSSNWKQALDEL